MTFLLFNFAKNYSLKNSTNCSLNSVSFGISQCKIKSCTSTSISCQTQSAYTTYKIDNTGKDTSKLFLFKLKFKFKYFKI